MIIIPLNDREETSYQEDDGIIRVPNVKTKNGGTVPVLVYDWQGGKVSKITRTVFYEKGPHGYIFLFPQWTKNFRLFRNCIQSLV